MKTVFDKATREELIRRINALTEQSIPQWGKMTSAQMVKHCRLWEEMILENKKYKRVFLGRLLGKLALRKELKEGSIIAKNSPSIPGLMVKESNINLDLERKKWIELLERYGTFSDADFEHPFFGKMTREEVGFFAYKHNDHHLRQFKV